VADRVHLAIRLRDRRRLAFFRLLVLVDQLVVAESPDHVREVRLLVGEAIALEALADRADLDRAEGKRAEERMTLLLRNQRDDRRTGRSGAEGLVALLVIRVAR